MGAREEAIVQEFCDAWGDGKTERPDLDKILSMLAEDVVWNTNVPNGFAAHGHAGIRALVEEGLRTTGYCRCGILHVGSTDRVVFHERSDRFVTNGKAVNHPLMAVYELDDQGKIRGWREYFDHVYVSAQVGELPGMPPAQPR